MLTDTRPNDSHPKTAEVKWICLPYPGRQTDKFALDLHRYSYRVGFYPILTISSFFKLKDPVPDKNISSI